MSVAIGYLPARESLDQIQGVGRLGRTAFGVIEVLKQGAASSDAATRYMPGLNLAVEGSRLIVVPGSTPLRNKERHVGL